MMSRALPFAAYILYVAGSEHGAISQPDIPGVELHPRLLASTSSFTFNRHLLA